MSLTEKMLDFVWNKFRDALDDEAEGAVKSLLSEGIRRVTPTEREKKTKQVLRIFADLMLEQFEDHQLLSAETGPFVEALQTLLANASVQGWLGEPLDPSVKALDYQRLQAIWEDLGLASLPADFDWDIVARQYLRKVRKVIEEDSDLRSIGVSQEVTRMRELLEKQTGPDQGFRIAEYRARIRSRYGHLRFDSFDVTGSELDRRIQLWKVFVPQQVKEDLPPLELPKEAIRRLEAEGELSPQEARAALDATEHDTYRQRYRDAPAQDVVELLQGGAGCPHCVIVGDPGSGKTSLLAWLLLDWAENPSAAGRPFPLMVELRQAAAEQADWRGDFCQYFAKASDALFAFDAQALDEHLRRNDSLFLVDGLDEVFDLDERERMIMRVLRFKDEYSRARVVVTSRKIGFKKDTWVNAGFCILTLQDFDLPLIETFLQRWHQLAFAGDAAEIQRLQPRLLASIRDYAPIRELAGNPLLLTMMAVVNRLEAIPRDRRALYERCADLLVHRWEIDRGRMSGPESCGVPADVQGRGTLRTPLDLGDKKTLLEIIAHAMQAGDAGIAGNLIEQEELKQIVTRFLSDQGLADSPGEAARQIMYQLRARNFILCFVGGKRYAFVHRTFLEYFCARYFALRLDGKAVLEQVVAPHWRDERWHEVIRLVVAEKAKQPEVVQSVVRFLLEQKTARERAVNVLLAADCAGDLRSLTELGPLRVDLLRALEQCFDFSLEYYYFFWEDGEVLEERIQGAAVRRWVSLQASSGPLRGVALDHRTTPAARVVAVQELARGWKEEASTHDLLMDRATNDKNSDVRATAVRELARGWKEEKSTHSLLVDRATNDEREIVRAQAVCELARGWKAEESTHGWLVDLATNDPDDYVRATAVEEVARGWKGEGFTHRWLVDRATKGERPSVRAAAVRELARGWKEESTHELLVECVTNDQNAHVRATVLQELAGGWKASESTRDLLVDRATNDQDEYVRTTAVEELAGGWKEKSTRDLLVDRATNDQDEYVRAAALTKLAAGWKEEESTHDLLADRATNDQDEYVRAAAVEELAGGWQMEASTQGLLVDRATGDEHALVRAAAVERLARGWKDDASTHGLLVDCATNDEDEDVRTAAVHELARGWKEEASTHGWLVERATSEKSERVRVAAVQELARGWKNEASTHALLVDRATNDAHEDVRTAAVQELARGWKHDAKTQEFLRHFETSGQSVNLNTPAAPRHTSN